MSRTLHSPIAVIEWSASGCTLFDPVAKAIKETPTLASAAQIVGEGREVLIALSRRSSFVRTTRLPDAQKADVAKFLSLQAGQLFPVESTEVAIDFLMTDSVTNEGRMAVVAAIPTDVLRKVRLEAKDAGLNVYAIVPVALGSELLARQLGKAEAVIIHETREGIALDIIEEAHLRSARVVKPLREEGALANEIGATLASLKLPRLPSISAGGFVYGGAAESTPMSGVELLSSNPPDLTFVLPEEQMVASQAKAKSAKRLATLLAVATLGVAAVVMDIRISASKEAQAEALTWDPRIKETTAKHKAVENASKAVAAMEATVDTAFNVKQPLGDVITVLTSHVTPGVWLTGITAERGKPLLVRGTATRGDGVQAFLENLSADTRFRDVKLLFANNGTIDTTDVVQFSLNAHIVGNFPVTQAKTRGQR